MVKLGLILGWKLAKSKTILDAVSHYRCDLDYPKEKADVQHVILKGPDPLPSRSQLLCDIQVVAMATLSTVPSLKAQLWKMSAVSHPAEAESKQIYPFLSGKCPLTSNYPFLDIIHFLGLSIFKINSS